MNAHQRRVERRWVDRLRAKSMMFHPPVPADIIGSGNVWMYRQYPVRLPTFAITLSFGSTKPRPTNQTTVKCTLLGYYKDGIEVK